MKRKTWFRIFESAVFVLLACVMLFGASRLLERKASRNQFGPFFEKPQQYDVLFFGDSRFVNCLFPMELWADYGIAGYNLSCYGNTMPVNYWAMMNAFDYAEPKVVVLAVNGVRKDLKVTGSSSDVHTAFDFFPLSPTKVRAIEDLMDDPEAVDDDGNHYVDMKWEYYFTLGKYHGRWNELTQSDLTGRPNVQKGADMMVGVAPTEDYDLIDIDIYAEEQGVGYSYMRRIIEECQSRGTEILLVHLPYPASENSQMNANTVGSIAEEYGVQYIDFVQLDSVVDYAVDCYDQQAHLNPSGGLKVTDYLGRFIADHYDVPDRRGDAQYASWQDDLAAYRRHKRGLVTGQNSIKDLLVLLHDKDFSVRLAVSPQACAQLDDVHLTLLHNVAREHVYEEDAYSKWSNNMFPLQEPEWAAEDGQAYYLHVDRNAGTITEYVDQEALAAAEAAGFESKDDVRVQVTDVHSGEVIVDRGLSL